MKHSTPGKEVVDDSKHGAAAAEQVADSHQNLEGFRKRSLSYVCNSTFDRFEQVIRHTLDRVVGGFHVSSLP